MNKESFSKSLETTIVVWFLAVSATTSERVGICSDLLMLGCALWVADCGFLWIRRKLGQPTPFDGLEGDALKAEKKLRRNYRALIALGFITILAFCGAY